MINKKIKILITLLALIILMGISIYYILNKGLDTSGWKEYSGINKTISFKYPASWSLISDTNSDISFYLDKGDIQKGLFTIEINNLYGEMSLTCKYCSSYSATVKNGKVALSNEKKFQQDTIQIVPQPLTARGYDNTTDRFTYGGRQLQIVLMEASEITKADADKSNILFKEVVSTFQLK